MNFHKKTKRGLAAAAYEYVKQQLFESKYTPGMTLPIDQIAAALSVSRQPVMDSMKELEVDGFILILPQIGCQVRSYGSQEISDFYCLFAFGEALIAELATQRASHEDLIKLKIISQQIGELRNQNLTTTERASSYRTLNRVFHSEIRSMARSPSVTEVVERMGDRSDFFNATSGRPMFGETLKEAHHEHELILQAMEKRDSSSAAMAMKQHIEATNIRLQAFLRNTSI
jgi:DNA-binding GntR family transcriptional regulator